MALESQIASAARGDTKPTAAQVFPSFLDTVTDASSGQWATFTVDVITHARRRNVPRKDLLKVLSMLGITSSEPKRRGYHAKGIAGRGTWAASNGRHETDLEGR